MLASLSFQHGSTPVEWMAGIQTDADVLLLLREGAKGRRSNLFWLQGIASPLRSLAMTRLRTARIFR